MIESPETSAYVPVDTVGQDPPAYAEDEDGYPKPADEVNLVRNKPVTSSLRQTIYHLRARAGFWSPLRGLALFLLWGFTRNIVIAFLSFGYRNPITIAVAAILAEVLLAHIHMSWIHVVISEPSTQKWWRRIPRPTFRTWRKIAPAAAVWAICGQVVYILPALVMGVGHIGHMQDPDYNPGKKELYMSMGQLFGVMVLSVSLFILLEIPAMVTMVRVAASMLPEEDETIVPFDRTYGGKVTPAIIGGEGKIDLVEAWKSFTWSSRKRLLTLCFKVAGVIAFVWLCFTFVVVLEAHLLFGTEAFGEMMKGIHGVTAGRG